MTSPRVAVFTPVYSRPQLVAEAIESTLAQTFGDFEHPTRGGSAGRGRTARVRR